METNKQPEEKVQSLKKAWVTPEFKIIDTDYIQSGGIHGAFREGTALTPWDKTHYIS